MILQKNFLEVYPYETWLARGEDCGCELGVSHPLELRNQHRRFLLKRFFRSGRTLPHFLLYERFRAKDVLMTEGRTQAPPLLSEGDLIEKMDKVGSFSRNNIASGPRQVLSVLTRTGIV